MEIFPPPPPLPSIEDAEFLLACQKEEVGEETSLQISFSSHTDTKKTKQKINSAFTAEGEKRRKGGRGGKETKCVVVFVGEKYCLCARFQMSK